MEDAMQAHQTGDAESGMVMQTVGKPWIVARHGIRCGERSHKEQGQKVTDPDDGGDLGNAEHGCVPGHWRKHRDVQIHTTSQQHHGRDLEHDTFASLARARQQDEGNSPGSEELWFQPELLEPERSGIAIPVMMPAILSQMRQQRDQEQCTTEWQQARQGFRNAAKRDTPACTTDVRQGNEQCAPRSERHQKKAADQQVGPRAVRSDHRTDRQDRSCCDCGCSKSASHRL